MKKIYILFLFIVLIAKVNANDTTSSVRFSGIKSLSGKNNWEEMQKELLKKALISMDSLIASGKPLAEDYFNRGVLKSALEDYSGAMKDYNKSIEKDSKGFNALVNRSVLLMSQKKYREALSDMNKLIKLYPDTAIVYNNRGFLLQAEKKYEEAIIDYTKSCELDKEYINPFVNRIRCYILLNKFKEAKTLCDLLLEKYPNDPKTYVELSDFYIALKDLDKAMDYLNKGVKVSNNDPEMYIYRSQFKDDILNEDLSAIKDCDTAITLAPQSAHGYYARCRPLFDLKEYDRIIVDCNMAISLDSTIYEAWVMRGDAYDLSGNIEYAKNNYEHAIRMYPKRKGAYIQLEVLYSYRNDMKNAIATLDRLIKVDSTNEDGLFQRGHGKLAIEDYKGAKLDFTTLTKLLPLNSAAFYFLAVAEDSLGEKNNACKHMKISDDIDAEEARLLNGRPMAHEYLRTHCRDLIPPKTLKGDDLLAEASAKEKLGDHKGIIEIMDKLIVLFPDSAHFYYGRGKEKRRMNNYEEAIIDYEKALSLNPRHQDALVSMGVAQQMLYRMDEAMATYIQTTELFPENEMAYSNIGVILLGQKKFSEAILYFKKAISIKPDYLKAIMQLGECYESIGDKANACITYKKAEVLGDGAAISKRLFNCY